MNSALENPAHRLSAKVGEVIESDFTAFQAQCYRLNEPPSLGSLVYVPDGDVEVMGVVSEASTCAIQPGRRPLARGENEPTVEALYANHPQIEKLLMTQFRARTVGFRPPEGSGMPATQRLPSRPPRVHAFVYECSEEDAAAFGQSLEFLSILIEAPGSAGDQLIGACLRNLGRASGNREEFLLEAGKALTMLLPGEPQRLYSLLTGIKP